jgi:phage baseplate assembly protein W
VKTLELRDGDLVIGPSGHALVTGRAKLRQDLSLAVREPYGCDRFHPRWGSMLDSYVGGVIDEFSAAEVKSEVMRVVGNYMALQQDQVSAVNAAGRKPTFGFGEVVAGIDGVEVRQTFDRLYVRVRVRTLSGDTVAVATSAR